MPISKEQLSKFKQRFGKGLDDSLQPPDAEGVELGVAKEELQEAVQPKEEPTKQEIQRAVDLVLAEIPDEEKQNYMDDLLNGAKIALVRTTKENEELKKLENQAQDQEEFYRNLQEVLEEMAPEEEKPSLEKLQAELQKVGIELDSSVKDDADIKVVSEAFDAIKDYWDKSSISASKITMHYRRKERGQPREVYLFLDYLIKNPEDPLLSWIKIIIDTDNSKLRVGSRSTAFVELEEGLEKNIAQLPEMVAKIEEIAVEAREKAETAPVEPVEPISELAPEEKARLEKQEQAIASVLSNFHDLFSQEQGERIEQAIQEHQIKAAKQAVEKVYKKDEAGFTVDLLTKDQSERTEEEKEKIDSASLDFGESQELLKNLQGEFAVNFQDAEAVNELLTHLGADPATYKFSYTELKTFYDALLSRQLKEVEDKAKLETEQWQAEEASKGGRVGTWLTWLQRRARSMGANVHLEKEKSRLMRNLKEDQTVVLPIEFSDEGREESKKISKQVIQEIWAGIPHSQRQISLEKGKKEGEVVQEVIWLPEHLKKDKKAKEYEDALNELAQSGKKTKKKQKKIRNNVKNSEKSVLKAEVKRIKGQFDKNKLKAQIKSETGEDVEITEEMLKQASQMMAVLEQQKNFQEAECLADYIADPNIEKTVQEIEKCSWWSKVRAFGASRGMDQYKVLGYIVRWGVIGGIGIGGLAAGAFAAPVAAGVATAAGVGLPALIRGGKKARREIEWSKEKVAKGYQEEKQGEEFVKVQSLLEDLDTIYDQFLSLGKHVDREKLKEYLQLLEERKKAKRIKWGDSSKEREQKQQEFNNKIAESRQAIAIVQSIDGFSQELEKKQIQIEELTEEEDKNKFKEIRKTLEKLQKLEKKEKRTIWKRAGIGAGIAAAFGGLGSAALADAVTGGHGIEELGSLGGRVEWSGKAAQKTAEVVTTPARLTRSLGAKVRAPAKTAGASIYNKFKGLFGTGKPAVEEIEVESAIGQPPKLSEALTKARPVEIIDQQIGRAEQVFGVAGAYKLDEETRGFYFGQKKDRVDFVIEGVKVKHNSERIELDEPGQPKLKLKRNIMELRKGKNKVIVKQQQGKFILQKQDGSTTTFLQPAEVDEEIKELLGLDYQDTTLLTIYPSEELTGYTTIEINNQKLDLPFARENIKPLENTPQGMIGVEVTEKTGAKVKLLFSQDETGAKCLWQWEKAGEAAHREEISGENIQAVVNKLSQKWKDGEIGREVEVPIEPSAEVPNLLNLSETTIENVEAKIGKINKYLADNPALEQSEKESLNKELESLGTKLAALKEAAAVKLTAERPTTEELTAEELLNLATIRKGEGIEHSFIRQLEHNPELGKSTPPTVDKDNIEFDEDHKLIVDNADAKKLHKWAQGEAHRLAIDAGYVNTETGEEVWVKDLGEPGEEGNPAYVLEKQAGGEVKVKEIFESKPVEEKDTSQENVFEFDEEKQEKTTKGPEEYEMEKPAKKVVEAPEEVLKDNIVISTAAETETHEIEIGDHSQYRNVAKVFDSEIKEEKGQHFIAFGDTKDIIKTDNSVKIMNADVDFMDADNLDALVLQTQDGRGQQVIITQNNKVEQVLSIKNEILTTKVSEIFEVQNQGSDEEPKWVLKAREIVAETSELAPKTEEYNKALEILKAFSFTPDQVALMQSLVRAHRMLDEQTNHLLTNLERKGLADYKPSDDKTTLTISVARAVEKINDFYEFTNQKVSLSSIGRNQDIRVYLGNIIRGEESENNLQQDLVALNKTLTKFKQQHSPDFANKALRQLVQVISHDTTKEKAEAFVFDKTGKQELDVDGTIEILRKQGLVQVEPEAGIKETPSVIPLPENYESMVGDTNKSLLETKGFSDITGGNYDERFLILLGNKRVSWGNNIDFKSYDSRYDYFVVSTEDQEHTLAISKDKKMIYQINKVDDQFQAVESKVFEIKENKIVLKLEMRDGKRQ